MQVASCPKFESECFYFVLIFLTMKKDKPGNSRTYQNKKKETVFIIQLISTHLVGGNDNLSNVCGTFWVRIP